MKGMTKGKAEEQRQIAANFKKQGVNIETIAQCTGLSVEEIKKNILFNKLFFLFNPHQTKKDHSLFIIYPTHHSEGEEVK